MFPESTASPAPVKCNNRWTDCTPEHGESQGVCERERCDWRCIALQNLRNCRAECRTVFLPHLFRGLFFKESILILLCTSKCVRFCLRYFSAFLGANKMSTASDTRHEACQSHSFACLCCHVFPEGSKLPPPHPIVGLELPRLQR